MKLFIYPNLDNSKATQVLETDWDGVVQGFADHERVAKKDDVPLWNAAIVPPGAARTDANVVGMELAVLDLDHVSGEVVVSVLESLSKTGFAYILHSTFSHNPEKDDYCYRLILRPDRVILPSEWPIVWRTLVALLGLPADKKCRNASHIYYVPSCRTNATPDFESGGNVSFGVDAILKTGAKGPEAVKRPNFGPPDPARKGPKAPQTLEEAKKMLSRVRKAETKALVGRILAGEPLAKHPHDPASAVWGAGRDEATNRAVSAVVFKLPIDTDDQIIYDLLAPSVEAMGPAPEDSSDVITMEAVMYKVARARERLAERDRKNAEQEAGMKRALVGSIDAPPDAAGAPTRWTDEQIEAWANERGETPEEFLGHLIIQHATSYYIFSNGDYKTSIMKDALPIALPVDLARSPVQFFYMDKDGNRKKTKLQDIMDKHCKVARHHVSSLVLQKSYYDAKLETFFESVRPLRKLEPLYNPEIQHWLELLGGADAPKLLDWISTITDLSRMSCAIYIKGDPGVGKGLLSAGLARLWHLGTPTDIKVVVSNFNSALCECPLVVADERLPDKGSECVTLGDLRSIIGATTRPLNRKFMATSTLQGAIRLLITANNDHILKNNDEVDLTPEDLSAISIRFMYINAPDATADYLRTLGGQNYLNDWVQNDLIAKHALWLRDNRVVSLGNRFLVEGSQKSFHNSLVINNNKAAMICEFLTNYIMMKDSKPISDPNQRALIRIGNGRVEISSSILSDHQILGKYTKNVQRVPSTDSIGRTLTTLALSGKSDNRRYVKQAGVICRLRFHQINPEFILRWCKVSGAGDPKLIADNINRVVDFGDEEYPEVDTKKEEESKVIDLFPTKKNGGK